MDNWIYIVAVFGLVVGSSPMSFRFMLRLPPAKIRNRK